MIDRRRQGQSGKRTLLLLRHHLFIEIIGSLLPRYTGSELAEGIIQRDLTLFSPLGNNGIQKRAPFEAPEEGMLGLAVLPAPLYTCTMGGHGQDHPFIACSHRAGIGRRAFLLELVEKGGAEI